MAGQSKTFRVFVSSTFSDLKAERDALQARVFPALREFCAENGARFQAIDLRWGVSQQASRDQQTMNICLGEIERCQEGTPRPNFIVLLGDRYGWCPPPPQIPAEEFQRLLRHISKEDRPLLDQWYHRDDNAVPAEYVLQPWHEYSYEAWGAIEVQLHQILKTAVELADLDQGARFKYWASATQQEIAVGALSPQAEPEHVFAFFRRISGIPQDSSAKDYLDLDQSGGRDTDARSRLEALKAELKGKLGNNVEEYGATWTEGGPTTDHIGQLCDDVRDALRGVIQRQLDELEEVDPLEAEISQHQEFGKERARFFTGRVTILGRIARYIEGSEARPLAIWGVPGSGKSALMAKAGQEVQGAHPLAESFYRFVGATPESSSGRALLEGLCRQISRRYGADEDEVPLEYKELAQEFPRRLGLATKNRPLVLFLDALDQLSDADNARNLSWLPQELPKHVRLVVSMLPGECKDALTAKLPPEHLVHLGPMPETEAQELLSLWLADAGRTVQPSQRAQVLERFAGCARPLYLKLAFEEARRWHSYDDLRGLNDDIPGIIGDLLARLSSEANHGEILVSASLGYLTAARNGLSEDELLDVLARDAEVYIWFLRSLFHTPPDLLRHAQNHLEKEHDAPVSEEAAEKWLSALRDEENEPDLRNFLSAALTQGEGLRLPVALWSRLYAELEPYLMQRAADGTSLLTFYHPTTFGQAAKERYLWGEAGVERHEALARYFHAKPLHWVRDGTEVANLRKLSELPYQETCAELWGELEQTLSDLRFVEAKCAAEKTYDLIGDYDRALDTLPEAEEERQNEREHEERINKYIADLVTYGQGKSPFLDIIPSVKPWSDDEIAQDLERILDNPTRLDRIRAFSQFVTSQSHTLVRFGSRRGFLLQQAHNSARSGPVASAVQEVAHTDVDSVLLMLHPSQRPDYNPRRGLLKTLDGHTAWVESVCISSDGRKAVSGSRDRTVRVWNLETGECLEVFKGHTDEVTGVDLTPDGRLALSGSSDKTLRVWDCESRQCLSTLVGHEQRAIRNPFEDVTAHPSDDWGAIAVSITPDGTRAVSGSADQTVRVWDLRRQRCLAVLRGHTSPVNTVAVTPNGKVVVSGGMDGTLRVWRVASGTCLAALEGHHSMIHSLSITPDGKRAVSGTYDGALLVWDLENRQCLKVLEEHRDSIESVSLTADGKRALSGDANGTLRIWDLGSGECLGVIGRHSGHISAVSTTPDGKRALSGGSDKALLLWDLERAERPRPLEGHEGLVQSVSITLDGKRALSGSSDSTLRVWDFNTGRCLRTLAGHTSYVHTVAIAASGRRAISGSSDETLRLWDLESGKGLRTFKGHSNSVWNVTIMPGGARALSGSWDNTLRIWDLESGECLRNLQGHEAYSKHGIRSVAITPDGRTAILVPESDPHSPHPPLVVYDLQSGESVRTFEGHTRTVVTVAVTPDGRSAISGSEDETLRMWDLKSGECVRVLTGHRHGVRSVSVAPDGVRVLSGSSDGTVRVWDLDSGACVAVCQVGFGVTSVSDIRPNGSFACGTSTGRVLLFTARNLQMEPPIVTAAWVSPQGEYERARPRASGAAVLCQWCGERFQVPDQILDVIVAIAHDADLSPDQATCLELPADAWKERRLLSECPKCHNVLRFNPFIIDELERSERLGTDGRPDGGRKGTLPASPQRPASPRSPQEPERSPKRRWRFWKK